MKPENKIKKKNKNIFETFVKEYQVKLNIQDYEICIREADLDTARASVVVDIQGRIVGMEVDRDFFKKAGIFDLKKTAFHECCEILLAEIDADLSRFYSQDYVDEKRHKIIRVLENIFFDNTTRIYDYD